ncbi:hypothetical protein SPRG_22212 [Saprolegnia parasitica CBS 223.65]|uniref:Uncharacterized protein n=1 Tax=Saprolegnia parasitica (strain CBS 223.65) TaxID=695850 RepID=A0A067C7N1_SAPPC|nr:hypothetical protein SPRG_22212 [Saprolegnia parasitica CBS 223.65]KDO26754.1 hypothetical protein SPRG_22212 [Saprolegnia parasitica CBS 223.65]|eukprot:XP_012202639.1 hypothetical protein SPRG_22212 [Saprolegnia parasitica CBS 223.65]
MPGLTKVFLSTKVYVASRREVAASGLCNVIQSRVATTLEALAITNAGIYCTPDDTLYTKIKMKAAGRSKLAESSTLSSPAEMYNWSVKPDRRIYLSFRMVEIQGTSIAGYSYNEGIENISQTSRPVTTGFCDMSRGLKGDPVDDEEDETELEPEEENKLRLRAIESEQMKTLVVTQLHKEQAMTKDVDNIMLQQRRKHIKQRITKLQDRQHGSSASSNALRSESSSSDSAPHDYLQQRAHMNLMELLVGDMDRARFNATELLARPDVDARRLNHSELHLHSGSSSMSSEGKRRSNSVKGRGVSSHSSASSSSNSSNGMRLHDPADYAPLSLDQLERELVQTKHEKTFRALLQKRADLKGKIARLEQQLVPEMPTAPAPLHPNASPAEITMYISGRKRELRDVVQKLMKTTQDKDSVSSSLYMARRKKLKQAILTAQEALQRASAVTTASTDAPTSRAPSEATMDAPAVEKRIAALKRELREIVSAVAQPTSSTAQMPELLRRRSIVKEHLAAAQDHLAQITSPDVEKARHEIAVVQHAGRFGQVVDLAKTSARNVFVNYARGNTFDLHVVNPGLLANMEEVSRFIAPSPAEAHKWVRAINDRIKVLETATPMGADGFGRNSVVF